MAHRRRRRARLHVAVAATGATLACTLTAADARAQLHWDAAAQVGVQKRFLSSQPPGGEDAGFGPSAQLAAHVALLPLVRIGGYVGHDISPVGGDAAARNLTWGGLRAKVMSPWPRGSLRAWLFVGFGVAGTYAQSYRTSVTLPGSPAAPTLVHGAGGHFFEVPFGLGASYKLRKPWELFAELGMRVGFAESGSAYEAPGPRVSRAGSPDGNVAPAGLDRFGVGLSLGVLVDM